jgi:hypothetical protein
MGLFGPTGGGGGSPTINTISQSFASSGSYTIPSGFSDTRLTVNTGFVGASTANIVFPATAINGHRIIVTIGTLNAFNIVSINGGSVFNTNGVTINNNNASAQVAGNRFIWEYANSVWVNMTSLYYRKPNWSAQLGSPEEILNKPTIPAAQVSSDWNATTGIAQILNRPFIPILLGHGSFSYAAGGNTRFFAQIFDLGAVTTAVERNFQVPQNCTIRAAIFSSYIGGTAAASHAGGTLRLRNKTTNTTQDILTYNLNGVLSGELGTYTASGLSLTLVAGDNYVIEQESGTFTTAPTSVRQMLTLYY